MEVGYSHIFSKQVSGLYPTSCSYSWSNWATTFLAKQLIGLGHERNAKICWTLDFIKCYWLFIVIVQLFN